MHKKRTTKRKLYMDTDNELKNHFRRMNEKIEIPQYNNAMTVSEFITTAIVDFSVYLPEIEAVLRTLKSRVYLMGFPLSFFNTGKNKFSSKNIVSNEICEHALWIEVNGSDILEAIIKVKNWNDSDIDRSLEKTGFLMQD